MSNCFLEGQFVSNCIQMYSFFCAKAFELSRTAPLCLFVTCCSEGQISERLRNCPRLMVRCSEDRLARGGEGRRSVLLSKHHVI